MAHSVAAGGPHPFGQLVHRLAGVGQPAREELGQDMAGAWGHRVAGEFRHRHPACLGDLCTVGAKVVACGTGPVIEDHVVVVPGSDADMLIDIDQPFDVDLETDLLADLAVQRCQDRFAVVDFPPRHHPLAAERIDAPPGKKHAVVVIDDAGDHRGLDVLFGKVHRGEYRSQNSEFRREATAKLDGFRLKASDS